MPLKRLLNLSVVVLLALVAGPVLPGCAGPEQTVEIAPEVEARTLVLVSIDGFRWDYLDRGLDTPALDWVAEGVRAERLVPVFPSKTFPNHYSLVTGLHPQDHGIVGNSMRDPERLGDDGEPERFSMGNRPAVADGRWWGGEPIWVTAERQGRTAAPVFWPGSEAEIAGVRPTHYLPFDGDLSFADRAAQALTWLDEGADVVTFYVEAVDSAGHRQGPDAPETNAAIETADAALGVLLDGLRQRGRLDDTDIVVVSDHGMTAVSRDRVVFLDDAVDYETVDVDWGEVVGLWPDDTVDVDAMIARVSAVDHVQAFRKADVPARYHYSDNPRIPPVVVLVEPGWTATSRDYFESRTDRPSGGSHGFDNAFPDMHGIFLARGPHLRQGTTLGSLSAVDVYNVLTGVLGLEAARNDGDPAVAARLLRLP